MDDSLSHDLDVLASQGLLRSLTVRPGPGGKFLCDGRDVLNFSSNDYLALAGDPRVTRAAINAVEQFGCGAGASRLMSGHLELHEQLETRLAAWLGTEAALVFGSGFLTNLGTLTALAGRGDTILADRLNHASLVDGARMSGADLVRYRHGDTHHLAGLLADDDRMGRSLVVTDSLFSMDGDVADLATIRQLADAHDATLIVDEAHAIGVLGPAGRGTLAEMGITADVMVGTMSKAMGGYGGFVAGSATLREFLINRSRSFIYSTGLPPACLGAGIGALDVIEDASGQLGQTLLARAATMRAILTDGGLDVGPSVSQIIPVMVGDNDKAVALSEALAGRDILAVAVRPPTVPAGTARLRLSITLAHTERDIERAGEIILAEARAAGIV